MRRLLACVVVLLAAVPVFADRIGPPVPQPVVAAATSDVVVTGTVTELEPDAVKAKPFPDAKDEAE